MAALNRSADRNVHIYDAQRPDEKELGGLILTKGVTNKSFYDMINIFISVHGTYILQHNSRGTGVAEVPKDDASLLPGDYYIVTAAQIEVKDEGPLFRTISNSSGTRHPLFREAVRSRDQQCVITGRRPTNPARGNWIPLEAAHIYPVAYQEQWNAGNLSRSITKPPAKGGTIDSVQNGLLLDAGIHQLFDDYFVAINPSDHYKIVFFDRDIYQVAGNYLRQEFLDHPDRPVDELLEWHFRQAVLTNMKGAGEPIFEHDFPSGSDMVGDILSGVRAGERMEYELFGRLAAVQDV